MVMRLFITPLAFGFIALAGCTLYDPTPKPDYTIRVVPAPNGTMVALPPTCPSYATATADPYDNQPMPQFGCATARNLAFEIERPEDLVGGRTMGDADGVTTVGAMRRYYNNQTRGLLWTGSDPSQASTSTMSTTTSAITGEVSPPSTSAGSSASGSPSSFSTAAPSSGP
jgi:hypothetical protein